MGILLMPASDLPQRVRFREQPARLDPGQPVVSLSARKEDGPLSAVMESNNPTSDAYCFGLALILYTLYWMLTVKAKVAGGLIFNSIKH